MPPATLGLPPATLGLALAALSALLAAVSHVRLKASADRMAFRSWTCLICAGAALPVALWSGPLPRDLWALMTAFALFSYLSQLVLFRSYALSDFSLAYPAARGIVPLATALAGIAWLGDRLSLLSIGGIFAISAGIVSLALSRGMSRHGWGAAMLTGLMTIGYTMLTAKGMRQAIDPVNFLAWLYVADGVLMPASMLVQGRATFVARMRGSFRYGWPQGLITLVSYSALAMAMRMAPIGAVSAIRESSVLIALVLAWMMLKERIDQWRLLGGLLIVAGAVTIVLG